MAVHIFRNGPPIDWANRWYGGMCPAGVLGGLPVREADYVAHPPLVAVLRLPEGYPCPEVRAQEVEGWWHTAVSLSPTDTILLLSDPQRARSLLLQAAGVAAGEAIHLPANADLSLTEAVKRHGARPVFAPLTTELGWLAANGDEPMGRGWYQPPAGLWPPTAVSHPTFWLDFAHTVPRPIPPHPIPDTAVVLYGLHLSPTPATSGALLHFRGADGRQLYDRLRPLLRPTDTPDFARAGAQYQRLYAPQGLAWRQEEALQECWRGLQEAAGLPQLPLHNGTGLPHAVGVQIPSAMEPATFFAYVQAENTPVTRLADHAPLHYAAWRGDGYGAAMDTAVYLARWLLLPVGPDYTDEEIKHTILGIVKAADYLGVRWYCDPAQANEYAAGMTSLYGANHDAYRPLPTPQR
jgi:hypothetical protein